jgi:hypothetical protein
MRSQNLFLHLALLAVFAVQFAHGQTDGIAGMRKKAAQGYDVALAPNVRNISDRDQTIGNTSIQLSGRSLEISQKPWMSH